MAFVSVFISSCSDNIEDIKDVELIENEAFAELNNDLDRLCEFFISTDATTRGAILPPVVEEGPKLPPMAPERRVSFWNILKADAKGFGVGFLVGFIGSGGNLGAGAGAGLGRGVFSSIKFWIKGDNLIPAPSSPGNYVDYVWDGSYSTAGDAHNYIIESLFDKYSAEYMRSVSDSKLYDLICDECAKIGVDVKELRQTSVKSDIIQSGNFIVNTIINHSETETLNILKTAYPFAAKELEVVDTYFSTIDNIEYESIPTFAYYYNELVVSSSIPVSSIETIAGITNVSVGSSYLWTSGF